MPTKEQVDAAVDAVWIQYVTMVSTYGKDKVIEVLKDQVNDFPDQKEVAEKLIQKIRRTFK